MDQILTLKHIDEKVRKKKRRVYVGFRDLEKSHDGVNREALWQILRIYDIEGKFLSGTMSMYVNGLACVRREGDVKECFKIESGVKQGCALSLQFFNVYMDVVMKEGKVGMEIMGERFLEEGREWRLPGLLYANDLVLCGESEEDLKVMVERFVEVCRRRGLKVNVDKSKVMVLGEEEGVIFVWMK